MAKGQQRDLKREAFWRGLLARFGRSGLSIRRFCAREHVSEPGFYFWRRVIQERDRRQPAAPAFVPLVLRAGRADEPLDGLTIELRGGRRQHLPATIRTVPRRIDSCHRDGAHRGEAGVIPVGNIQVRLATGPVDMRRSFDGLAEHVRGFLGHDLLSDSLFVWPSLGPANKDPLVRSAGPGHFLQAVGARRVSLPDCCDAASLELRHQERGRDSTVTPPAARRPARPTGACSSPLLILRQIQPHSRSSRQPIVRCSAPRTRSLA